MKVCIFGAGAIGGHVAARLARGGAQVSVVARGASLAAIRAAGLTVTAPDGVFHAKVTASGQPAELGPQDAVLVTVKAPSLPAVAAALAPLLGPATKVAYVMNGIPWWYATPDAEVANTLGGVVWSACTVTAPGHIQVASEASRLVLGAPDGADCATAEVLAALLRQGGMGCQVVPDIRREVWLKLINNLTNGPLCLLSGADMRRTMAEPALQAASLLVLQEALAIAAAEGHDHAAGAEARLHRSWTLAHKPSILQDREAGRPMEIEALFEAPLAIAAARGVPAPTLAMLVALARLAINQEG